MQALTVLANALWAAMLLPGVLIAMQCGVIECEERYRERGFGDEYRRYQGTRPAPGLASLAVLWAPLDWERVMELLKHRLGGPSDAHRSSYVLDEGS